MILRSSWSLRLAPGYVLRGAPGQEAKQTGALQAAKGKLEKQLEEATWRLDLEKRMRVSPLPASQGHASQQS